MLVQQRRWVSILSVSRELIRAYAPFASILLYAYRVQAKMDIFINWFTTCLWPSTWRCTGSTRFEIKVDADDNRWLIGWKARLQPSQRIAVRGPPQVN